MVAMGDVKVLCPDGRKGEIKFVYINDTLPCVWCHGLTPNESLSFWGFKISFRFISKRIFQKARVVYRIF